MQVKLAQSSRVEEVRVKRDIVFMGLKKYFPAKTGLESSKDLDVGRLRMKLLHPFKGTKRAELHQGETQEQRKCSHFLSKNLKRKRKVT